MDRRTRAALLATGLVAALGGTLERGSGTLGEAWASGPGTSYSLTFDYSYSATFTMPPVDFISFTHRGQCGGTVVLRGQGSFAGRTSYLGGGTCTGFSYFRETFSDGAGGGLYQESDCRGTATSPAGFEGLLVVHDDGTFDLTPPAAIWPGTVTNFDGSTGPATRSPDAVPHVLGQRRSDPKDPVISFNGTVTEQIGSVDVPVHFTATLTPVGPPPKLVLEQTDKTRIPVVGETITAKVSRVGKSGCPVPIRFLLEEVTSEPGVCLNGADDGTAPDLDFAAPQNLLFKPPVAVGTTGFILETIAPATSATCEVAVRDYGAWGRLRAEEFHDGAWHAIPVRKSRQGFTTVPIDVNSNKIADKWEKDNRLRNPAGGDDAETKPPGKQTVTGDGFSNYEEYRGVFSKGAHKRLDPRLKELAVENHMAESGEAGLALFQGASGIPVIRLKPEELPTDRVVNAHHGLFHNGDQHGLELVRKALAGDAVGEAAPKEMLNKRPRDCTEVVVDEAKIARAFADAGHPELAGPEISSTIAHEIAHAIGVEHHGDPVPTTAQTEIGPSHLNYRIYDTSGAEITARPYPTDGTLLRDMEGPHNEASGDVHCVMCYASVFTWCVVPPTGPEYSLYQAPPAGAGTRFCRSPKGTGMNARGKYFGDAVRGNCLGQMRVKDY